jgi:hypothetical protein
MRAQGTKGRAMGTEARIGLGGGPWCGMADAKMGIGRVCVCIE